MKKNVQKEMELDTITKAFVLYLEALNYNHFAKCVLTPTEGGFDIEITDFTGILPKDITKDMFEIIFKLFFEMYVETLENMSRAVSIYDEAQRKLKQERN